ncbi:NfeD family protein [Nocardioides campestrisoli]|uniref:NfeD family protein n=1 Tax=Nocardioides campestrisoli TaxID=2736757 RepID=UPI0015E77DA6|nr:NfeD family protein [Nocardioides campestrisoli]
MDWFREHAWETWLGVAVLLGVAEMFSLDLVLIMLAAGAVVGMLAAMLDLHVGIQVVAAAATSMAALLLLRPSLVGRLHGGPELRLGHTRLVGKQALVTEDITGTLVGRIRLDGEIWSALPYDDTLTIPAGATVEVLEIRGATALVHPIAQLEP